MNETQIRERLHAVAVDAPAPTTVPRTVLRRARARVALTVAASVAIVVAVISGSAIGLRELTAPEPRPATPPPAIPPPSPARLGALAYAVDGDIYVAEPDGSNAVRIADGRSPNVCDVDYGAEGEYWGRGRFWSPDRRYLAYRHTNCDPRDPWRTVVISDPEGNVVAEFPAEGWDISWSSDSTRVAVWVRWGETIGVFGVDGVRQALLTVPPGWEPSGDHDPEWSPDGESLLVAPGDTNAVEIPLDGSAPRRLPD